MKLNKTLIYFLVFTAVSSFLAYKIVVKAYDGTFDYSSYEAKIINSK
ncbi:MAG: hypothetical protein KBC44_00230 [Candidatus Pacebacteria bacterium]|nr:hypothetical protein [Candidatus Paceibacterota bacterium]MBP9839393.1 hypothetical protein [Candidatus Paceibacterota bacterium]